MVVEPEKAFIMGGTWRVPVLLGLQDKNFISDLKRDPTFNEASFGREYKIIIVLYKFYELLEPL